VQYVHGHFLQQSPRPFHTRGARLANKDLQENILQPWRGISPVSEGGGGYLNEARFYGGYYGRLSAIRKKWDLTDFFYAITAVGSERWVVQDGEQGVQTQAGRLCRA
jgi:hypothetical protein